jgi:hypothetical protein
MHLLSHPVLDDPMRRLTIVTNACATDDMRLGPVLRSWLRVFGGRLDGIVVVVNPVPPTGRIAELHGAGGKLEATLEVIREVQRQDGRIESVMLPGPAAAAAQLAGWFVGGVPFLCQAGTPLVPFVYGMAHPQRGLVLRTDCDMVFHETGFVDRAAETIESDTADLVEPYRWCPPHESLVSTRAFLYAPERLRRRLPLRHATLDVLRSLHRTLQRRPRVLALEQSLTKAKQQGRISHLVLPQAAGWSLHFGRRSDFAVPGIEDIMLSVEAGRMPQAQQHTRGNFDPAAWERA